MRSKSLIIFDWDGTLADSMYRIIASMQQAAERVQQPVLEAERIRHIIGLGLPEAVAALYPDTPAAEQAQIQQAYRYCFQQQTLEQPLFAGVEPLLQRLLAAGKTLAVATGKSRSGLNEMLKRTQLQAYFQITRCADETTSKPDPQMLQEILQHTGHLAAGAVLIGDSIYDIQMAQAIGMSSIGVTYGACSQPMLQQAGADHIVHCVNDLTTLLLEY